MHGVLNNASLREFEGNIAVFNIEDGIGSSLLNCKQNIFACSRLLNESFPSCHVRQVVKLDLFYHATKKTSCLQASNQPGNQWFLVLSEGLCNKDKVPCPMALLLLPADFNPGPHDWQSVVLSNEPQQLFNTKIHSSNILEPLAQSLMMYHINIYDTNPCSVLQHVQNHTQLATYTCPCKRDEWLLAHC